MRFFKQSGLLLALLLLVVSCGTDKNFGDAEGITTGLDLKTALDQTMDKASVLATSLRRQDDTPIAGVNVELSLTLGALTLFVDQATSNELGLAGNNVSKQTYDYRITGMPADVGEIITRRTISITGTSSDKFRASSVSLAVSASDLSSLQLDYFRVDSAGVALDFTRPALSQSSSAVLDNQHTQVAELFAATYRVRVQGQSSTGELVTQIGEIASVVGTVEVSLTDIVLDNTGNTLTLNLLDNNAQPIQGQANANTSADDVRLLLFDVSSGIELGRVQFDASGQASMLVSSSITDVVAFIVDFSSTSNQGLNADSDFPKTILGLYRNQDFSADDTQQLSQFLLTGQLQLAAGEALDANDSANIMMSSNDVPDIFAEQFSQLETLQTAAGSADFSALLFAGNYTVTADSVEGFPAVSAQTLDVAADSSAQIAVARGGLLSGVISDENNAPLAGVSVSVYAVNSLDTEGATAIAEITTTADGAYSFDLAEGDYDLWVNGAVSENISVIAAQTTTKNIQRFNVSGTVVDINNSAISDMDAFIVNGATTAVSAGTFSLPVFEGLNALCYRPSASQVELGLECHLRVMVDQAAVNSL